MNHRPPQFRHTSRSIHQHIEKETLDYFSLPWEWDKSGSDHIVILKELENRETDLLFDHTKLLRSRGVFGSWNEFKGKSGRTDFKDAPESKSHMNDADDDVAQDAEPQHESHYRESMSLEPGATGPSKKCAIEDTTRLRIRARGDGGACHWRAEQCAFFGQVG
ncbi:hypothetical protein IWX46DRAFT_337231 [Phyllosticta citricarpa]|uniref:Uncharacterized protein n=1 Tax=Phyllosticta citricarpa TaxID=55181 RepID=A0ABR1LBU7_9PEZI